MKYLLLPLALFAANANAVDAVDAPVVRRTLLFTSALRVDVDHNGTISGWLPAGTVVDVNGCVSVAAGRFCAIAADGIAGHVAEDAIGSADEAFVIAAAVAAVNDHDLAPQPTMITATLSTRAFTWRDEQQRAISRRLTDEGIARDMARVPPTIRLGVVGLTRGRLDEGGEKTGFAVLSTSEPLEGRVGKPPHQINDARRLRDGEEVLALCDDGPRRLPVRVHGPRANDTAVDVDVACAADVVIAGLPPSVATSVPINNGRATLGTRSLHADSAYVSSGADSVLVLQVDGRRPLVTDETHLVHAGDYNGDGRLDGVVRLWMPAHDLSVWSLVLSTPGDGLARVAMWVQTEGPDAAP